MTLRVRTTDLTCLIPLRSEADTDKEMPICAGMAGCRTVVPARCSVFGGRDVASRRSRRSRSRPQGIVPEVHMDSDIDDSFRRGP